ncbi:MAG: glucose-6-phosphate isomerase [Nitrospirae bacterium]|nr:glucose-6-phosphate isomerase [Nitrospirota bacterium]
MEQNEIRLDFNFMMREQIGEDSGIDPGDIDFFSDTIKIIHDELRGKRKSGELPFFDLPYQDTSRIKSIASEIAGSFDNFLLIGIGGSALGPLSIHNALHTPFYNQLSGGPGKGRPRIYFLDNVDPDETTALLEVLDLKKTVIVVVTKSGGTAETMAGFLVLKAAIQKTAGKIDPSQVIAITDPDKSDLLKIARKNGYRTLEIPAGVGGRFSVLTPVGLLSAAVSGINIDEMLAGAALMDKRCSNPDAWHNPAYMKGLLEYMFQTRQGRHISVMMAYSEALGTIIDWFVQLWAESLGKKHGIDGRIVFTGQTPVKAIGATDQHSQLQLYMEGPHDKTITFLRTNKFNNTVSIPEDFQDIEGISYLGGHTLNELILAEQKATEVALARNGRPSCRIDIPAITPSVIGQLFYMFEVQTAFAGGLYKINAFDQPGVEEGKKLTFGMMGRKGFEDKRNEIEGIKQINRYII